MNSTSYVSVRYFPIACLACGDNGASWAQLISQRDAKRTLAYAQEELAFIWVLLITTTVATFFIEHYKITAIPPSGAAMALGMVFGGIGRLAGKATSIFWTSLPSEGAWQPALDDKVACTALACMPV